MTGTKNVFLKNMNVLGCVAAMNDVTVKIQFLEDGVVDAIGIENVQWMKILV